MKAIFDTKPNSGYDDELPLRYHFPANSRYVAAAEAAVGDWIIYREPRRNAGRQAYIAVARVREIVADTSLPGHAYALMDGYLPFDELVPFESDGRYWEASLRALDDRRRAGAHLQGDAMRVIEDSDFNAIVTAGLRETLSREGAERYGPGVEEAPQAAFEYPFPTLAPAERRVEQLLLNRKIRDANFRRQVCIAYQDRCAVTGLRIINGGGRSEVQAAHIWSVAEGGPDVVQNGLALSGTVHWLFDRHLISLTDEYRLLVSHNKVPPELRALFEKQMDRIHLPPNPALWPRREYVARHRDRFMAA